MFRGLTNPRFISVRNQYLNPSLYINIRSFSFLHAMWMILTEGFLVENEKVSLHVLNLFTI